MLSSDLIDVPEPSDMSSTGTKGRAKGHNGLITEISLAEHAQSIAEVPAPFEGDSIECDHPKCTVPSSPTGCSGAHDATMLGRDDETDSEFGPFVGAPSPDFIPEEVIDWIEFGKRLYASVEGSRLQAKIHRDDHETESEHAPFIPSACHHKSSVKSSGLSHVITHFLHRRINSHSQQSPTSMQQFVLETNNLANFEIFIHEFLSSRRKDKSLSNLFYPAYKKFLSLSKEDVSVVNLFYPACDYRTDLSCGPTPEWDRTIKKINKELKGKATFQLIGDRNFHQDRQDCKFALLLRTRDKLVIDRLNKLGINGISVADSIPKHRAVTR